MNPTTRFFLSAVFSFSCAVPGMAQVNTTRVSVDSQGNQGFGISEQSSINYDGRYVVFVTKSQLAPEDTNSLRDIYRRDRVTGQTILASRGFTSGLASGGCQDPSISPEGDFVAFSSKASTLVPGDTNAEQDVFLHEFATGVTTRVSVDSAGNQGDGRSRNPKVSALGRHVVFQSRASNLVPGDTNLLDDIFLHEVGTGTTTRASVSFVGTQLSSGGYGAAVSWGGRYVAFASFSADAVFGDTNNASDVFVRDLVANTTERVSVTSAGLQVPFNSYLPSITADGREVAFRTNLAGSWGNAIIYVHDRASKETTLESVFGATINNPSISSNGQFVTYDSNDGDGWYDVYVKNRVLGTTTEVSTDSSGAAVNGDCSKPTLSGDGSVVCFESVSADLVPFDTNGVSDIFINGSTNCSPIDVYCESSASSIAGCTPLISATGVPSSLNTSQFEVSCSSMPGGNVGMLFFGGNGPGNFNVGTLGGKLCVLPPFDRTPAKHNGGNVGVCNGFLQYDLSEMMQVSSLLRPGSVIHAAFWIRDPANADGFAFSNGLEFTLCQ